MMWVTFKTSLEVRIWNILIEHPNRIRRTSANRWGNLDRVIAVIQESLTDQIIEDNR
jgi:hypothetical protein